MIKGDSRKAFIESGGDDTSKSVVGNTPKTLKSGVDIDLRRERREPPYSHGIFMINLSDFVNFFCCF